MYIVYNGIFREVAVPSVGDVVLKRGVPKDVADTPKSRGLLNSPDFSLVDPPAAEPEPEDPPADESEDTEDESAEDAENNHDEDVI